MDSAILAALITSGVGIVGSISGYLLKQYFDSRIFLRIRPDRRAAITGKWTGSIKQEVSKVGFVEYPVLAKFSTNKREIKGEFTVKNIPGIQSKEEVYDLTGGFLYYRFLRFDYQCRVSSTIAFGTFVLELSADGARLTGRFLGYGAYSEQIVCGIVVLHKAD